MRHFIELPIVKNEAQTLAVVGWFILFLARNGHAMRRTTWQQNENGGYELIVTRKLTDAENAALNALQIAANSEGIQ